MEEFYEYLKVRKDLYIFLAKIFYKEVTEEFLEDTGKRLPVFKAVGTLSEGVLMEKGCSIMADFLENAASDKKSIVSSLECLFARNFLGVSGALGEPSVALCESVYLSPRRIMMQEERDMVVEFYNKFQMTASDDFHEPEDHITAEMGFLSKLSGETYEDISEGREDEAEKKLLGQLDFLEKHLGKWITPLCEDLRSRAGSPYYEAISYITEGFVLTDIALLKSILKGNTP